MYPHSGMQRGHGNSVKEKPFNDMGRRQPMKADANLYRSDPKSEKEFSTHKTLEGRMPKGYTDYL